MEKKETPAIFERWYFWVGAALIVCIAGFMLLTDKNNDDGHLINGSENLTVEDNSSYASSYAEGSTEREIDETIHARASEQYEATSVDSVLIYDETDDGVDNYSIMANLTFDRKNHADTAKDVVDMYADDLAAWVGREHDCVTKVYVYWTLPNIVEEKVNTSTPYMIYEKSAGGMVISDKNWPY